METRDSTMPPESPVSEPFRVLQRLSNELNSGITPGLIHEANNVLTGIYFNLEALQEWVEAGSDPAERLGEIAGGIERIKEILARTTQIHLNVAERELGYHDLEALVASQMDLLRVVFPKTAKISLQSPRRPVNVRVAEFPFRVALLAVASRIRDLFPNGRIEVPITVLATEELKALGAGVEGAVSGIPVGVSFRLPCPVSSAEEIDDYLVEGTGGDLSMNNAISIFAGIGGRILFHPASDGAGCDIVLLLPRYDLNP